MAEPRTLDVPESQVCLDFFEDPGFSWHHRLLLVPGNAAGEWVVATPDGEIQLARLGDHRVVALQRNAPFPARVRGDVYAFDVPDDAELERMRLEGRALGKVLGFALAAAVPGAGALPRWIVADTASDRFGKEVDLAVVGDPDRFVSRDATGLALIDDDEGWVGVENVAAADEAAWVREKRSGPGRDPRVLSVTRAPGTRAVRMSDAVQALTEATVPDWPFRGPRALPEFVAAVESSGHSLTSYWGYWVSQSGVARAAGASMELKVILDVMHHALTFDCLDVSNLASFELMARRALQIQRAVRRCPRHPSFDGLDVMLSSQLDESGGIVTSRFDAFVAEEQKSRAQVMKQQRMWAEERQHEDKKSQQPGPKPVNDPKGRGRGGKGGRGDGGAIIDA